jgi:hypothetical protein
MVPGAQGGLLVVIRFAADVPGDLLDLLSQACALLSAQGGLRQATIARATDDRNLVVLTLEWDSVGAYRRALSNFEVKVSVVPLLSRAIDEPTAFEILHVRDELGGRDSSGALAADADRVRLGEAASGYVPPA